METSANETEAPEAFQSPPRRRRSTFFIRRDSIVPQPTECDDAECAQDTVGSDAQKLTCYFQKLLAEKEQWKKELSDRRHRYHDLRQQYQLASKSSRRTRISYATLSNEDIEFLKGKPNLSKLIESQQKLHKSLKETRALFRRANELDDVILSYSEQQLNKITEYIFENSTVE